MKAAPFVLVAYLVAESALANVGGYAHRGVSATGTILGFEPADTAKVRILDEQLIIALEPQQARVQIRYVLKNTSRQRANVRFGFPVEELEADNHASYWDPEFTEDSDAKLKPRPLLGLHYCHDYHVELAGKPLVATFAAESKGVMSDPRVKGLQGWMVSKMSLQPGEEKTMSITYRGDYPYGSYGFETGGTDYARLFTYRLSTAACWDGPITRGTVTIKPDGLDPSQVRVLKPANRFQKLGDQWVWTFENLKPSLAADLIVEAVPEEHYYGLRVITGGFLADYFQKSRKPEPVCFLERRGKWSVLRNRYHVVASSTLPPDGNHTYSAENIIKGIDPWSEGAPGPGIGEWLELTPEFTERLLSLRIRPGYGDSPEHFAANARPKRLEILLNGEHRFETTLADINCGQTIPIVGYSDPVKKIRLTIKDVYPGTRFEDCCISYIILETPSKIKPRKLDLTP